MPIIVHSPYSGREVKIRDQDVGRAVRDEENRIFYVLERADGSGHYSAQTRAGNPREEERYDEMVAKIAQTRASGQLESERQVHDAMGKPRANLLARAVVLIVILLILAAGYLYLTGHLGQWLGQGQGTSPLPSAPQVPALPDNTPPTPSARATQGRAIAFSAAWSVAFFSRPGVPPVISPKD